MIKPDQQVVLDIIFSRIGSVKFGSSTQMESFKVALIGHMDARIHAAGIHNQIKQDRRKADAARAEQFQAKARGMWCAVNLHVGDKVKIAGSSQPKVISRIDQDTASFNTGTMVSTINMNQITQIQIDGKWKSVYKLASNAK